MPQCELAQQTTESRGAGEGRAANGRHVAAKSYRSVTQIRIDIHRVRAKVLGNRFVDGATYKETLIRKGGPRHYITLFK